MLTSCVLPSVMRINVGMLPCRSSSVCIFTAALCRRNFGPREQRQAKIDGGGIQSVQSLIQIQADRIAGVQGPGDADQDLGEVGVDPPIAGLVGIGPCRASHLAAESHVVELSAERTQARLDIAEALAVRQLGERHAQKLIPTGEATRAPVAVVAAYAAPELAIRKEADQLGEDGAAQIHEPLSAQGGCRSNGAPPFKSRQQKTAPNPRFYNQLQAAHRPSAGQ